jgi:4-hydroxybenzoyl-CoA thioesterase
VITAQRSLTIEWGHCDPAGIVFYPRYFEFFDAATAGLFHTLLGITKAQMIERYGIVGFPMVNTQGRFLVPIRSGETVVLESQVTGARRSSFDVQHTLLRGGDLAVEARETRVWVRRDDSAPGGIRATSIPDDVIKAFHLDDD